MAQTRLLDLGGSFEPDPSSSSQPKTLTWRRDPEDSFSDWTIVVNQKSGVECEAEVEQPPATYHIHKNIVGAGRRSSEYFRKVFQNKELEESKTSTTILELETSAARAFPDMLDFIYTQKIVCLSSNSAVAVRHLASYFCVPTLFQHTNKFIQKDVGTSNIHVYLKEALLYLDDKMIRATMEVAANSWMFLAPTDSSAIEPARYLELLPQEKQLELMQLALQRAASAHRRSFKRVPCQGTTWKRQDGKSLNWREASMAQKDDGMTVNYRQLIGTPRQAADSDKIVSHDLYFLPTDDEV
jgi:hypothetical protein